MGGPYVIMSNEGNAGIPCISNHRILKSQVKREPKGSLVARFRLFEQISIVFSV